MKHDYTDEEIRSACKDVMSLRAFLEALPTRSAEPAEIASFKAALAESEKQFQDKVYEIARLLDECDKAQGILKACLSVMPFGNIKTHTFENLPGRIADLASEIASLSLENERLEAELAALRQSTQSAQTILADDGRSLGQVAFDAGNAIQKIKFPKQEIETWEESAEVRDMLEAAAQAVAAEVEARMIKRMEAVPAEELEKAYWDGNEAVACHTALKRVRARLIAAAKGEGQPVVVNEPPQHEGQPDLSGGSEKQDLGAMVKAAKEAAIKGLTGPAWIPHDGGSCPLKDEDVEQFEFKIRGGGVSGPVYAPNGWRWSNDGTTGDIIAYRVLKWKPGFGPEKKAQQAEAAQPTTSPGWTPTVGQTVRLKSGGPVMTVYRIAKDSSFGCLHNVNGPFQCMTLPSACLTQVPNP